VVSVDWTQFNKLFTPRMFSKLISKGYKNRGLHISYLGIYRKEFQ
jgi:hypothetical protein